MSKPIKLFVPVVCHNGHKAISSYRFSDLDLIWEGVPKEQNCPCPKWNMGDGWFRDKNREPYLATEALPEDSSDFRATFDPSMIY